MSKNILFIVDPQNDFCDPKGSLYVPGAENDCLRISNILCHPNSGTFFSDCFVSMDMHNNYNCRHTCFWKDKEGNALKEVPTLMYNKDMCYGNSFIPATNKKSYTLDGDLTMIWPKHCIVGTWGSNIQEDVEIGLNFWEENSIYYVNYLFKGRSPLEEEYGVLENKNNQKQFLNSIHSKYGLYNNENIINIYVCGEARMYCVKETILQIARKMKEVKTRYPMLEYNIYLISDCTSNVNPDADDSQEIKKLVDLANIKIVNSIDVIELLSPINEN